MTDYEQLVKALRYCGNFTEREGCAESCEYYNDMDCPKRIMTDAAAAIEALQAEVDALKHDIERYVGINAELTTEIEALQAEQKKTVTQIFGEEQMAWEGRCKDQMKYISDLQAEVDTLKRTDEKRCQECLYLGQPVGEQQLPKLGEWIWMQKANGGQYKGCSVCHAPIPTDSMLDYLDDDDCEFCYSCGAKMEVQDG